MAVAFCRQELSKQESLVKQEVINCETYCHPRESVVQLSGVEWRAAAWHWHWVGKKKKRVKRVESTKSRLASASVAASAWPRVCRARALYTSEANSTQCTAVVQATQHCRWYSVWYMVYGMVQCTWYGMAKERPASSLSSNRGGQGAYARIIVGFGLRFGVILSG